MCHSQSQKPSDRYYLGPRDHIFQQTVRRPPAANHISLGSWMVHSCQECHSLRSAPRGDTQYTWDCAFAAHSGNPVVGTREMHKMHVPPERVCWPSTQSLDWLEPGKGTKHIAHLGLCPCSAPKNLRGSDLGST